MINYVGAFAMGMAFACILLIASYRYYERNKNNEMSRTDQFAKVVTYSMGGEIENISSEEADLRIIKSVLKINFVLNDKLGISLKEDSPIEMFLEFIEKLNKFLPEKA